MSAVLWGKALGVACVAAVVALGGCSSAQLPSAPRPPATRYQTLQEVIGQLPSRVDSRWDSTPVSLQDKRVGLTEFGGDVAGASQATAVASSRMGEFEQQGKLKQVDRTKFQQIEAEVRLEKGGDANASAKELAKRVGEKLLADYFLIGGVSDVRNIQQSIPFRMVFRDGEIERYRTEYADFKQKLDASEKALNENVLGQVTGVGSSQRQQDQVRIAQLRAEVKPPEYYEQDIESRQRSEFKSIATVTVNARLIDVRTTQPIWHFESQRSGEALTDTMRGVIDELLERLVSGR